MDLMEKIVALCKRRGFIYPGSEIYGGLNGTWDLGPLGTSLARNIKHEWWQGVVFKRDDVVGLNSSILHHPKVWEASGHIKSFTDPLVECKKCHKRFRPDVYEQVIKEVHRKTPKGGVASVSLSKEEKYVLLCVDGNHEFEDFQNPRLFNLMFKTFVGPIEEESSITYLRPETAQGIFINFKNVLDSTRIDIPFGIAQIGKGFRNEITTGNFLFRVREFEMMELEFFVEPGTDEKWHEYWKKERLDWYVDLGIKNENIKIVDLPKKDIAHYSRGTAEVWYNWPFMGFGELEGIANRGDYDLAQHSKYSGQDLSYTGPGSGRKFIPYVIEPSVGVGRAMLAFLVDAYKEDGDRVMLRFYPKLAPYKVAVFPLVANKPQLVKKARNIYDQLKKGANLTVAWDDRGNIGKRYYSQDEIGTPWCVTVDYQTLDDETVTVRDRDTAAQERMAIPDLDSYFSARLK